MIDLRSDTVTRPCAAMREAMATAEVGDDVYREDPTVQALEERSAELLGKEAALFVPTGTMANQLAILCHCRPGDHVLLGEGNHMVLYESGAGAAWGGVQFGVVGSGGLFDADGMEQAIHPSEYHFPPTTMVAVENTQNRSGGRVFPLTDLDGIFERARSRSLATHLDGARVWNASVATGETPARIGAGADTVSACFSKGLGAPIGSVFAGPRAVVDDAFRFRKMLGGGMRQVGILAAAALHALDHNMGRLAEDHANASRLAAGIASLDAFECDTASVETNIVNFDLRAGDPFARVKALSTAGLKLNAIGGQRLRAVTHLDVAALDIDRALEILASVN